jgi:hypothetical protein
MSGRRRTVGYRIRTWFSSWLEPDPAERARYRLRATLFEVVCCLGPENARREVEVALDESGLEG